MVHIFAKTGHTHSTHCSGVLGSSSLGDATTTDGTAHLCGRKRAEDDDPGFWWLGAISDGAAPSSLVAMGMATVVVMGGFLEELD